MAENLEIECNECNAVFTIKHNLNIARYEIRFCTFCGGEDIDMEEDYDDEEESEDYY